MMTKAEISKAIEVLKILKMSYQAVKNTDLNWNALTMAIKCMEDKLMNNNKIKILVVKLYVLLDNFPVNCKHLSADSEHCEYYDKEDFSKYVNCDGDIRHCELTMDELDMGGL